MSNSLVKRGQAALVSDDTTSKAVGGALVKTGLGATVLWLGAGVLPFITFPMLLIALVIFGGYLYIKD